MKIITQKHFNDILDELHYLEQQHVISAEQIQAAKQHYQVKPPLSILSIILTVGAILIGIGVLIAVSTNWMYLAAITKFTILIGATVTSYVLAFSLQTKFKRTSRALYYVAVFIAGASLYFIEGLYTNMVNFTTTALLWALIIAPLAYFLRDVFLSLLFAVAVFIATVNYYDASLFYISSLLPFIAALAWFNMRKLHNNALLLVAVVALTIMWLTTFGDYFNAPAYSVLLVVFGFGLTLFFTRSAQHATLTRWLGTALLSFTGAMLMSDFSWQSFHQTTATTLSIIFTIGFAVLAFSLLRTAHLQAIVLIAVLIITVYTNYTFDLIPKSVFFVVAGLLLIGFGYWFERTRREADSID
ncbi:MAG TPA: DUF2157 domain-containing protein [Metalysinibacillus jejuensis]|uniref:DUF2157 domain-containing protein n=1 Tax=Metalysinibacillus jejuensis TaxID=914327 RepID=A0A921T4H2_9BACL|nr:DUF2157 domain-containing protein [Metalysinibacillus jejuensis]